MSCCMKEPLFQDGTAILVHLQCANVPYPAGRLAVGYCSPEFRGCLGLGNDVIAVNRIDGGIAITVEHDGWNDGSRAAMAT